LQRLGGKAQVKKSDDRTKQLQIYQTLINHIRTPAWIMTEQADIIATNPAWKSLLGDNPASSFWDYLDLEQRLIVENRWATGLLTHGDWSTAFELVGLKCQIWQTQFEPLAEDEIQGQLWLATAEPIDRRIQQATQSLSKNSEFVWQVLESNHDCIKVIDLEGALLYMNQGGQLVMEIDDFAQVKQAPWLSFWSGCNYDAAKSAFYQARSGQSARFEGFCPTAKGTPRWWDVWVTPMFDAAGNVAQVLSVSRDITERKQAEQALAKQNQELEQFTYAVSHDLKSPLRSILNLAHWLEEDLAAVLPDESRQHLQLIQQRVRRMNALVEGLLDLSRVGRKQFHLEPVDVSQLLLEVVDLLAPRILLRSQSRSICPIWSPTRYY
jgi:PAS domain S-box-containing protein